MPRIAAFTMEEHNIGKLANIDFIKIAVSENVKMSFEIMPSETDVAPWCYKGLSVIGKSLTGGYAMSSISISNISNIKI